MHMLTPLRGVRRGAQGGAYAAFMESEVGVLRPGAYADLVVLSGSPLLSTPARADVSARVLRTYVSGQCAYCPN